MLVFWYVCIQLKFSVNTAMDHMPLAASVQHHYEHPLCYWATFVVPRERESAQSSSGTLIGL